MFLYLYIYTVIREWKMTCCVNIETKNKQYVCTWRCVWSVLRAGGQFARCTWNGPYNVLSTKVLFQADCFSRGGKALFNWAEMRKNEVYGPHVQKKGGLRTLCLTTPLRSPFILTSPNRIIRGNTKRSAASTWTFRDFYFKNVVTGAKACVRSDHLSSASRFEDM